MNKLDIKYIVPLVLLLIILGGGIYYYQQKDQISNSQSNSSVADQNQGIVLGENSANTASEAIADASVYSQNVLAIRQPINQGFEDLTEKSKYTNLFSSEDIQQVIDETRIKIEEGMQKLENWSIAETLRSANNKHLESLKLLLEAINAYDQSQKTEDKKEAQRWRELYAYNIEQSNKILKNIQIGE